MFTRTVGIIIAVGLLLAGCGPATPPVPDLSVQAAAQATQIIQQAQATALIQNARATANALLATPASLAPSVTPQPAAELPDNLPVTPAAAAITPQASPVASETAPLEVRLMGVSFGADNNLISVQFLAPMAVVKRWQQGNMYVLDEATGARYEEIPVMPVVGALFARPAVDGQPGYVMFTNRPIPLQSGAQVTVVLGEYRWEHIAFPSMINP